MRKKPVIKINSLIILLMILIFLIVTLGGIVIGRNAMQNVFERTSNKYLTQSISLSQNIFNRKIENVVLSTNAVDIPQPLINVIHQNTLREFLQQKLGNYLDFFIYVPNDKTLDTITEGVFLYDISLLEKKIKNNDIKFKEKELVILEKQDRIFVFILSSKKIINKYEGRVVGRLIGGVELGFQSSFLNNIMQQTELDEVHLMTNSKALNLKHKIPKETPIANIDLFQHEKIIVTNYYNFLFDSVPSKLQISMTKYNDEINTIIYKLKKSLFILPLIFVFILLILLLVIKKILVTPLIKLKEYSIALSNEEKNIYTPRVYISEYKDLAISLRTIFQELLKSKKIQENQFLDLSNAKAKIDENLKIIDKFVLISTTNLDGDIIYTSSAFAKLSGYTKEELLGKNHRIMKNPKMQTDAFKNLWETISLGNVWQGEVSNLAKDGTNYWTNNTITPVFENDKIVAYTAVRENITSQKIMEELSIKDVLTGLFNRRYIEDRLINIKENFDRYNESFCIAMIDIDNFKDVNDVYGHQTGDEVLKSIANILKENSRVTDVIGRWGGEEFLLIMTKCTLENAQIATENLRQKVESTIFEEVGIKTISIGLSTYDGNIETTIKSADKALYKAKNSGRNKVKVAKE